MAEVLLQPLQLEEQGLTRRAVLTRAAKCAGAAALITAVPDELLGLAQEDRLTAYPEAQVKLNPTADRTTLVLGGLGNDGDGRGFSLGDTMWPYLRQVGSTVNVRYAQKSVNGDDLTEVTVRALREHGLQRTKVSAYLNSAAGIIGAPVLRNLANAGYEVDDVVLDCSPQSARDIVGLPGYAVRWHLDALVKHSYALDALTRFASNLAQPSADDKAPLVPLAASEAYRQGIVNAPLFTLCTQVAALRTEIPSGLLDGVGGRYCYMHSRGPDPLINNPRSMSEWQTTIGRSLVEVVNTDCPESTHAPGATYPEAVLRTLLGPTA